MAESGDLISSLYPPPPPYVRYFSDENMEKYKNWKKQKAEKEHGDDIEPVPREFVFFEPPKHPEGSHYRGYGNIWSFEDKLPSLKEMGLPQLYQENDDTITSSEKIKELHKLLDSLLLNFLELVGVVSVEPEKFHTKIEDLKNILINMNHILNSYRPHQSRESLIMLLKKQIESKRQEMAKIDRVTADISSRLNQTLSKLATSKISDSNMGADMESKRELNKIHTIADQLLKDQV